MSRPFFTPKMFSPGDRVWYHSRTLGAHVLWGLHQMGRNFATCGAYTLVGSLTGIMRVLNPQGLRLWWLHHASRLTCVMFVCISGGYHSLP